MGLKSAYIHTTGATDPVRMKRYMETETDNLPTVQHFKYLGSTIYRRGGTSKRRGEQNGKCMVEIERSDWSKLRQESTNENEAPDIPDNSTDVALQLRNMAKVMLKMKNVWQQ